MLASLVLAVTVVKIAGAAYLGVHAMRTPETAPDQAAPASERLGRIFRDGFLVTLLNPKTALFFAAFLPQFMAPHGSVIGQSVALGAIFVAIAALSDTAYALAAGWISPRLGRLGGLRRAGRYVTGGAFIALGLLAAFTGRWGPTP